MKMKMTEAGKRQAPRKSGRWVISALVLVVIAVAAVMLLPRLRGGAGSSGEASSSDAIPETIPAAGFTLTRMLGQDLPVAIPLYPGGKVYGTSTTSALAPQKILLEGVYADPKTVAAYYQEKLKSSLSRSSTHDLGPTYYDWLGTCGGSHEVTVYVRSSAKGLTRDLRMWTSRRGSIYGGDPKETMITVLLR
jgi:hypothetical protein